MPFSLMGCYSVLFCHSICHSNCPPNSIFYTFSVPVSTPRFAPLWYHFPSVRQMVFNASFNGVQRVSSAPLVPGCCAAWSRSMSCHRSPLICHRSPPFLAVSHARALLYYARVCTKTVRTPAKPLCKRVLSHSRTSAHRTKEKPPGSRF